MGQDRDEDSDAVEAILARGRLTRTPLPRGLWIAGLTVGVICATGFAVAWIRSGDQPARSRLAAPRSPAASPELPPASPAGAGFATGLVVGGAAGLVIGVALARQRRDHSSRSSP
jgi:hypothetical protein